MKRFLTDAAFTIWKPYASWFRGAPRRICDSIFELHRDISTTPMAAFKSSVLNKTMEANKVQLLFETMQDSNLVSRTGATVVASESRHDPLELALVMTRMPTGGMKFDDMEQWCMLTSTGAVFTTRLDFCASRSAADVVSKRRVMKDFRSNFVYADDPAMVGGLSHFLNAMRSSSLSALDRFVQVANEHPSAGVILGFAGEIALGLAFTEYSHTGTAFVDWISRLDGFPGAAAAAAAAGSVSNRLDWNALLSKVVAEPSFVVSPRVTPDPKYSDIPRFDTFVRFVNTAVHGFPSMPYYYLPDTDAGPDGCMLLKLESGAYLLVLVGLKWFADAVPASEKRKNERSVNPAFLYCDLKKESPVTKEYCQEKRDACWRALNILVCSKKLAGILSFEFNFDATWPEKLVNDNPFHSTVFEHKYQNGTRVVTTKLPWLRACVTKAHILKKEDAFKNSILFDFAEHRVFQAEAININTASKDEMAKHVFGVGDSIAEAIVEERKAGNFSSLDQALKRLHTAFKKNRNLKSFNKDRLRVLLERFVIDKN